MAKISRNSLLLKVATNIELDLIVAGKGKIKTISISKTRNRIVKRKNRKENGMRADFFGSKPHSNGEDFSRSIVV